MIICAYTLDRWGDLEAAVQSCRDQSLTPDEIILVIDYNDELEHRARGEFKDVQVVSNHLSKGLSGARNSGVLAAAGDVLVFLDDDAYADQTWLEELCRPLEADDVSGSGGWIVPHWPGKPPRWFPLTFLWVLGCSYEGLPPSGSAIRNPIGASMAMKREIFDSVGGFTSGIGRIGTVPLGCEETELCIRFSLGRPDQKFVLARDAIVHHRVPRSRLTTKYFLSRCWAEGLSKAAVSTLVGATSGLSSERRHVTRAIPREVAAALVAMASTPRESMKRIAIIVGGSFAAAAGLVRGTMAVRKNPVHVEPVRLNDDSSVEAFSLASTSPGVSTWRPIAIISVDVEGPITAVQVPDGHNERVWLEATRHGQVIARGEVIAKNGQLLASDLEAFARRSGEVTPLRRDVTDEELPRATVVVPTICRHPQELVRTVEHILDLDYPYFDVVLVDNRTSNEGPFPDFSHEPRVCVVNEPQPGISAARNRGVQSAKGEFVAFTDDDVVVDRQWLRAIGTRLVLNPEVDAVGGLVLPAELATEPQVWFEEFYGGFSQSFELDICTSSSYPDDPLFPYAPGRFGAGCNMAFRREALVRLGGFRPELGTGTLSRGGEDLAAFFELIVSGATVAFEPAALVRHFHRRTLAEFQRQVFSYGVGLAAFYTREILHQPRHITELVRRIPAGVKWLSRSRSDRSPTGTSNYPYYLKGLQFCGILIGPVVYLRSALNQRRNSENQL